MSREQDRFDKRLEETAQELDQAAQETLAQDTVKDGLADERRDDAW